MSHQSELAKTDIAAYLKQHENKQLLRLLTCGSVDDGKSTLIGRLLYDSKMIYEDQLAAVTADSAKSGTTGDKVDLALLVDGLQAEREQGITIDVAYRYFSTSRRKFIIADTPGHEQYTRNMVTGASTCDLAIILIDARSGVKTQTKRHSYIASLLGIKHVVVAVNKMDLMSYDEGVFNTIRDDFLTFSENLNLHDINFIPLSALEGDNVVSPGCNMPWYKGSPLMQLLEDIEVSEDINLDDMRFPVQYVNRPNLDFRGYCGTVASGVLEVGKEVVVYPSMKTSRIESLVTYDGGCTKAFHPMAVTVTLEDDIDVSRGDVICYPDNNPLHSNQLLATIVWMAEDSLQLGKLYDFKHGARYITGHVGSIENTIDVNTAESSDSSSSLDLNEIAICQIQLNDELTFDSYISNKNNGCFIIVDRLSNVTVGCGMILGANELAQKATNVSKQELESRFGHKSGIVHLTGNVTNGVYESIQRAFFDSGLHIVCLGNDEVGQVDMSIFANSVVKSGLIFVSAHKVSVEADIKQQINAADITNKSTLSRLIRSFRSN